MAARRHSAVLCQQYMSPCVCVFFVFFVLYIRVIYLQPSPPHSGPSHLRPASFITSRESSDSPRTDGRANTPVSEADRKKKKKIKIDTR